MKASEVLEAIESYVDDDFLEAMNMDLCSGRLQGHAKEMAERLSAIYRISHAFGPQHSCHSVHIEWRRDARKRLTMIREERNPSPATSESTIADETDGARRTKSWPQDATATTAARNIKNDAYEGEAARKETE